LIALTPSGRPFSQSVAKDLAQLNGFSLLCGRYEGFDQRALDLVVDDEISLGDFVLAGGELAALCVVEAVVRLLPGALGNETSTDEESFEDGLLEYPQFTKPQTYRGLDVPEVLLSGDHARVARWRRAQALRRTIARRPDLLALRGGLSTDDQKVLDEFPEVRGSSPSG
jgi:tRNA (guanine37-N1)-methyltransferase